MLILDFSQINSKEKFMDWLSYDFKFPSYFGRNWDAVWDCLSELSENKSIKIVNKSELYSKDDYLIFENIIEDFNKENVVKINLIEE